MELQKNNRDIYVTPYFSQSAFYSVCRYTCIYFPLKLVHDTKGFQVYILVPRCDPDLKILQVSYVKQEPGFSEKKKMKFICKISQRYNRTPVLISLYFDVILVYNLYKYLLWNKCKVFFKSFPEQKINPNVFFCKSF